MYATNSISKYHINRGCTLQMVFKNIILTEDVHYEWYLKMLSILHKPLGECNLKEFSNHDLCKSLIACGFIQLLPRTY